MKHYGNTMRSFVKFNLQFEYTRLLCRPVAMISYSCVIFCEWLLTYMTVRNAVKFYPIVSRKICHEKTLVDKIVLTLYAKFFNSSASHAMQSLLRRNRYFDSESSYEQ